VEIEGVRFNSKVLSKCLANIDTVIPYVFTCGKRTRRPAGAFQRPLALLLPGPGQNAGSDEGRRMVYELLKGKVQFPGSDPPSSRRIFRPPIEAQVPLFSLFQNTEGAIGVKLTSNKTIYPVKSGSGLLFYNGTSFVSCELCLQPRCAGRRVAYNPKLAEKFGIQVKK